MAVSEQAPNAEPDPAASIRTFKGKLELQSFAFKPDVSTSETSNQPLRRSSRLSSKPVLTAPPATTKIPIPIPIPSASPPSSRKRKATTDPPLSAASRVPPSPSPRPKRKRQKSGYAPPSTYAHLPPLPDVLAPNLLVLFVGLNPGLRTASSGHAYAHPSNLFWKLLHSSGLTPGPRRCDPAEDRTLPGRFGLGNTNIVARPSRNGGELSRAEMDAGVAVLEAKAWRWRPEVVCLVGKSIWESVWRVRHGRALGREAFRYGWQDEAENLGAARPAGVGVGVDGDKEERQDGVDYRDDWKGARVFVATSTSGLAASLLPAEKERVWKELGEWAEKRRAEKRGNGDCGEG